MAEACRKGAYGGVRLLGRGTGVCVHARVYVCVCLRACACMSVCSGATGVYFLPCVSTCVCTRVCVKHVQNSRAMKICYLRK